VNIYSISVFMFSSGVLLNAILIWVKRGDRIAIRFLLYSFSICVWGFLFSIWINQDQTRETTLWLSRLSHLGAAFIPITFFHFMNEFLGKKEPFKYCYFLGYSYTSVLSVLSVTPIFIPRLHSILEFEFYTSAGPAYHFFTLFFALLVPYAIGQLICEYRKSSGVVREQLRYLLIGTVVGFFSGSGTFLPIYHIPFPLYGLVLMPIYPLLTGIALIKYGLFDERQLVDAFQREKLAAIGTMAASLNHELRNPLYIAKGKIESQIDAINHGFATCDSKNYAVLSIALDQLTRAMDIIQRFSDFAKPQMRGQREWVVLKDIFNEVVHLVANEFEMKNIQLIHQSENKLTVFANRRQLEEIFFNLIINACHAMEKKGGRLSLNVYQPNGKVIVEISDTGMGIPKDNQKRIFEPFYSTKAENGSGLGLFITKQLVERNGGKISVKSKLGEGTKFTLTLPGGV
jgi:signal transduction histidine kinase